MIRVALLGDIALLGGISSEKGGMSFFSEVSELLGSYDYVIGNLETPFSARKKTYGAKSAYICANPQDVMLLKALHVDAVSLANNHMFDYGREGYELTKKLLKNNNIEYFGCEGRQVYINLKGNRVALSGFCCYSTNPLCAVPTGNYGINEFDPFVAEEVMKNNYSNGFLNLVSVHAGLEHVNYPSLNTVRVAKKLANICPYVYYGHHPHVAQGIENYQNSLIAYSLGNFCFDDIRSHNSNDILVELSENNRSTFILELLLDNSKVVQYKVLPLYIGKNKIILGKGTDDSLVKAYTKPINELSSAVYTQKRNSLLHAYYASRKKKRNWIWYLKHLRLRYAFLVFNSVRNNKKYKSLILKYIEQ